jgi:hypothetical protein
MEIVQSFWHGDALPRHLMICMKSFLRHGHQFHLYAYREYPVPAGVVLKNAAEILPECEVFHYIYADGSDGGVAAFADLFRYELLLKLGNWWVDTDVLCLSDTLPPGDYFFGWEQKDQICNAILKLPPESELARQLAEGARAAGKKDLLWGQIGPALVTQTAKDLSMSYLSYPPHFAYPIHWSDYKKILFKSECASIKKSVAGAPFLHLWNQMFRLDPSHNIMQPEEGSFWAQYCW